MDVDSALTLLQLLQAAAALFLAWRLLHFGLLPRLRSMLGLQIWTTVSSIAAFVLYNGYPKIYFWFYAASVPIGATVNIFAVNELFGIIFDRYPGIRTVGRLIILGSVSLAVTLSLLTARLSWSSQGASSPFVARLEVTERSVVLSLAIFILCALFFLSRYPMQLPRNFSVSSSLFCTVFLTEAFVLLVVTLSPRLRNQPLELAQMLVSIVCLVSWAMLLQPSSADANVPEPAGPTASEKVLLAELARLNELMGGAARR